MNRESTKLIALDLDGTSAVYEPRLAMHSGLIELLADVRHEGFGWVMNSDRYAETLIEIALELPAAVRPEAILSIQRFIHMRSDNGTYESLRQWNDSRMELHCALWRDISSCFNDWQREIEADFTVLDRVVNDLVFAYMVPAAENAQLRRRMGNYIRPWPHAQLSGNHEWSFVLHADFSKANLLEHYCAVRGSEPRKLIAVGDGFNDISMLNADLTPYVGCPADASPEVIDTVRGCGGFVAGRNGPEGTIDVICFYRDAADSQRSCASS